MSQHNSIYMYPTNNEVSLGNFSQPYSKNNIVLYKGSNNPLSFTIHNADGKYLVLNDDEELYFVLYDAKQNRKLYECTMFPQEPSWISEAGLARPTFSNKKKVYYGCDIPAYVLADVTLGTKYRWSIYKKIKSDSLYEPIQYLYVNTNYQVSGDVKIDSAIPIFNESYEVSKEKGSSWLVKSHIRYKYLTKGFETRFPIHAVQSTTPIQGTAQTDINSGMSTVAIYLDNFVGRIQLQGSLDNDCPDDTTDYKWFILNMNNCDEYLENTYDEFGVPIPLNGIYSFNIKANIMWFRVLALTPPTKIKKPNIVGDIDTYNTFKTIPKILYRR